MIKNNKLVSNLKLPQQAIDILERYNKNDSTFVFPMFYGYTETGVSAKLRNKKTASSLAMINKNLKSIAASCAIEKNLTMHIARHSFANIAKDGDTSVEIIKELLNHSSIKTTYSYLASFSSEKLESASTKVYADFG